jgi:hypothetical protein
MWRTLTDSLARAGNSQIFALFALAIVLAAIGVWLILQCRQTPLQREHRRRVAVHRHGRMGDATIVDVREQLLHYSYQIRGVAYTASQDISALRDRLPEDLSLLIGHTWIKYSTKNPANSIVVCEEWSGLRPVPTHFQVTPIKENVPQ